MRGLVHPAAVNDLLVGRSIRLLRLRGGWRQSDLAQKAGVSPQLVSLVELGHFEHVTLKKVRLVFGAVDADAWLDLRWRGGVIERVLDERHAALVGIVASTLSRWGWEVVPEVSYSVFGERGSIDLVAWHAASGTLLVIEIKTELVSAEGTLRKLDEKDRLAPKVVRERFGWRPERVSRLLVLPADRTQRRHVARHAAVLDRALPVRGDALRASLRRPNGRVAGLWFVAAPTPAPNLAANAARAPRPAARRRVS
jgi:transcriptional regulator with XRE-family HTH domain